MHGKVVVVTGASGALGKVVAETALARGAKVAGVDHAPSATPAAPERIELGGVDLSDGAQAKVAIDAVVSHFGRGSPGYAPRPFKPGLGIDRWNPSHA